MDAAIRLGSGRASAEDERAFAEAQARAGNAGKAYEATKHLHEPQVEGDVTQAAKQQLGLGACDLPAPTISADNVGRNDGAPFFGGKTDSSPPDRARHAPSPPSSPPDGRRGAA